MIQNGNYTGKNYKSWKDQYSKYKGTIKIRNTTIIPKPDRKELY